MSIMKVGQTTIIATLLGALLATSYGCDQQKPKCATGRGAFIAKYTYVSGPDSCASLKGEKLGLQTYNATDKTGNNTPDLDHASIAIQSESLGLLVDNAAAAKLGDPDPTHKPYSFGAFTTSEPSGNFCVVPRLSFAMQTLPEVPEDKDAQVSAQPATDVTYEWVNVKVYVTATAYGTQFSADLRITTDGVGCEYSVQAMYPYVDCSAPDPNDATLTIADPKACAAEADVASGRSTGSGISPDFPVTCDEELKACVLTKAVPALN